MGRNTEITSTNININSVSRISAGTIIKGSIVSPCDIRIDGEFEGEIRSEGRVVVGESAIIKGNIFCHTLDLFGSVDGDVYVNDILSLKSGCTINGNLNVKKLYVELDAAFNGNCRMITDAEFAKLSPKQAATDPKATDPKAAADKKVSAAK